MTEASSEFEPTTRQNLRVSNSEETPIVLCLEPWANELLISEGDDCLVVFDGPQGELPEVEWSKERITVYGWSGCVAWVFLNRQIVLSCDTRVPEIPGPR